MMPTPSIKIKNALTLSKIGQSHLKDQNARRFIVINGMSFYQSSGGNSKVKGTWFPCSGCTDRQILKATAMLVNHGVLNREEDFKNTDFFPHAIIERARDFGLFEDLSARFGNVYGMLLSSRMDENNKNADFYWNTFQGRELKKYLMVNYPDFYSTFPSIEVSDKSVEPIEKNTESVNKWLVARGANPEIEKEPVKGKMPCTESDFKEYITSTNKVMAQEPKGSRFFLRNLFDRITAKEAVEDKTSQNESKRKGPRY